MTKTVRRFKLILGLMSLFAVVAVAQVSVSMPAVVVDRSGQPVHGLQKSDFEVRGGKDVSFDAVEEVPPLNFTGFGDPVPVFILFDEISFYSPVQGNVARWLLEYLRKSADEHLAVTLLVNTPGGIRVIHDMSTNSRVFSAAMDRVLPKVGQPPTDPASNGGTEDFNRAVSEEAAQLQELTKPTPPAGPNAHVELMSQQLESLRSLGKMLQRSRKRKPLVWIAGSFPIHVEDGSLVVSYQYINRNNSIEFNGKGSENEGVLNAAYQAAIDSLNEARISLYPLAVGAPRGIDRPVPMDRSTGNNEIAATAARQSYNGQEYMGGGGLGELAARTGGGMLASSMDFAAAVADLRKHFDSYYMLTLSTHPTRKRTWVDASVKVSKPDTKMTAANGFFSTPR